MNLLCFYILTAHRKRINIMEIFSRYEKILNMHNKGMNVYEIAKEFGTSYANSLALLRKAKEYYELCNKHPFYLAIIEATKELKVDERNARACFNVFYCFNSSKDSRNKSDIEITLDDIESHKIDLNKYTDEQLLKFNQLGKSKLRILRVAQYIYNGEIIPKNLIDSTNVKNYVTGADICRWIRKYDLQDKKFYNALDGQFNELWFYLNESNYTIGILHVDTGELETLECLED